MLRRATMVSRWHRWSSAVQSASFPSLPVLTPFRASFSTPFRFQEYALLVSPISPSAFSTAAHTPTADKRSPFTLSMTKPPETNEKNETNHDAIDSSSKTVRQEFDYGENSELRLDCSRHDLLGSATRISQFLKPDVWPQPQVCVVGRTNAGKSSLLNHIFHGRALAKKSSIPGCTHQLDFFNVDNRVIFVDTPGYGTNLDLQELAEWRRMLQEYLSHSKQLKMVLLLMDIRTHPTQTDREVIQALMSRKIPVLLVLTKDDAIKDHRERKNKMWRIVRSLSWKEIPLVHYSIKDRRGRGHMLRHVMSTLFQPEKSLVKEKLLEKMELIVTEHKEKLLTDAQRAFNRERRKRIRANVFLSKSTDFYPLELEEQAADEDPRRQTKEDRQTSLASEDDFDSDDESEAIQERGGEVKFPGGRPRLFNNFDKDGFNFSLSSTADLVPKEEELGLEPLEKTNLFPNPYFQKRGKEGLPIAPAKLSLRQKKNARKARKKAEAAAVSVTSSPAPSFATAAAKK